MLAVRTRLAAAAPALLRDAVGLAGAAGVTYGTWLIYPPVGFIVGGLLALGTAWLLARAAD
jgi:hypothetical protein